MNKIYLPWKILLSILLAIVCGAITDKDYAFYGINFYQIYSFAGTIFLNALKMLIVPLISAAIITSISGFGDDKKTLGRLGIKTVIFYVSTSFIAIIVGLIIVNIVNPGIINNHPINHQLGLLAHNITEVNKLEGQGLQEIIKMFTQIVPANIFEAASKGNMLGVIFFSFLFGLFMSYIDPVNKDVLHKFWKGIFDTMMLFIMGVMKYLAPIGVFGLVAKTISETGFVAFKSLLYFIIVVISALSIHIFIVLPIILLVLGKINPIKHFRAMMPALITAFSTSSSTATLPLTMECVEKNAGVSPRISRFVLPLGIMVNMNGSALYECVVVLFLAQAYGVDLTFYTQITIASLVLLTSTGVAGVPAGALVAIMIVLSIIGIPAEGIGIIMITERFLDMFRSVVNVFGDSCGAVVIAKTEGEEGILK